MKIKPGSIVAVKSAGILGWLDRKLIDPPTDRYHHFTVREYQKDFDDYEIVESNMYGVFFKGVMNALLLDTYTGYDIEIYEVNAPSELCKKAPIQLLKFGSLPYDVLFICGLFIQLFGIWFKMLLNMKFRKLRPEDFKYTPSNGAFVCTEAVWVAYNCVGINIFPPDVPPFPNVFKQALDRGDLKLVFKGVVSKEEFIKRGYING